MKTLNLILFFSLMLILSLNLIGCRCPVEKELTKSQIPTGVLQKANQYIISKTGSDFFYKNITIDLTQSKSIPPNYFFVYRLVIHEKAFVNEQIRFTTDSLGKVLNQFEIAGIPECINDQSNCDFVVDEKSARQIAVDNGLSKGIKDWDVDFVWEAEYNKYVWKILSTLKEIKLQDHDKIEAEVMIIDPTNANVIEKKFWQVR